MSKQEFKVFWEIDIYPDGYDGKSERKTIELSWTITADDEEDAMDQVREDNEIIGVDFIGYPDDDYIDSHPDIEIVWTDEMSTELVIDLTKFDEN